MNRIYCALLAVFIMLGATSRNADGEPFNSSQQPAKQSFKVKGKVTDEKTAEPIIGATVMIQGTGIGTITDINGEYTIDAPAPDATIVFSFVGYESIEMPIESNPTIDVQLSYKVEELEQVVCIGYSTTKKADVVGAIASINSKEINSLITTNVSQAIQGRAAGVEVINSSGAPGASVRIKVRGTGTVNNSDPLYVVDGFIVEDIKFLNPEDIKDFQVLKDASSSAIYGARAANGVVLITTRRGEKGGLKFNFSANFGTVQLWNIPERTDKREYQALIEEAYGRPMFGSADAVVTSPHDSAIYHDFGVENWLDYIYRTGISQKYNLQMAGGNEKNSFLLSGTWADDKGVFITSSNTKRSLRLRMDNTLGKYFTLKSGMSVTSADLRKIKEDDVFTQVMNTNPFSSYYYASRIYYDEDKGSPTYGQMLRNEKLVYGNVYSNLMRHNNTEKFNQYDINFDLESHIGNVFTNNARASYVIEFWESSDAWARDWTMTEWSNGVGGMSSVIKEKKAKYKWQAEDIFSLYKEIGGHSILLLSGVSMEGYNENYMWGTKYGAPDVDLSSMAFDANYTGTGLYGAATGWKSIGIPARLDYNYKHRYFFQANCRADASSKFSPDTRWGFFPSLSAGWTISEEPFMQRFSSWLAQLKLRANWGRSGNNRIDDYAAYTMISTGNNRTVVYGRNPITYYQGWSAFTYGNPLISWEKTTGSNVGIDWSLFKGSLSGSFDLFRKTTSDMLLKLPLPLSFGTIKDQYNQDVTPWQNAGSVENTGYEIVLAYMKVINDFSIEVRANYSHVDNKVTKLGEEGNPVLGGYYDANGIKQTYLTYTAVGQPIGMFYGWKIDKTMPGHENGIWRTSDALPDGTIPTTAGALPQLGAKPGDYIFTDMNGDAKIDEQDKTYLGSPHPKGIYGLNLNVRYKNVELTAFFQGVYGNKILNTMRYYSYSFHENSTAPDLLERSWSKGDREDAEFPIITYISHDNNNYRLSDFYIEDGSYLRLKNTQLSYNIPVKWVQKIRINSLRIAIGATNLLTFTKYTGFDPEIGGDNITLGIDKGTYPQGRTYTANISIGF
jgi:TonB-dependent starch-binding outer membrane protein SusC